jgi:CRISPR-associated protein Csm3
MNALKGKVIIEGTLKVLTGMHIGGSSDFAAIGAVDSVVIKDPVTKLPIIPGTSLKGKLRYLLARTRTETGQLDILENEHQTIKRLFGASKPKIVSSRLIFQDVFMTPESVEKIRQAEPDLYVTEIKFENSIDRQTAVANPRQLERVPAGAEFTFKLIYNIEDETEMEEDLQNILMAIELLELDYLGGHGTRGYGRVGFSDWDYEIRDYCDGLEQAENLCQKYFKKEC